MADKFKDDVKRRFDDAFGLKRLTMFSELIASLEKDGHTSTANALRALVEEEQKALNPPP